MVELRPYRASDLDALYDICLATGDYGRDAGLLYSDRRLIGHIYAAPYGVLEPSNVFVAEDDEGVAGYVVGTHDTDAFEARLEREWWPPLREHYSRMPTDGLTPADRQRIAMIRHPESNPADIVAQYPAHIHMNLLPRLRGQRVGTGLLQLWVDQARQAGVRGIHLGAGVANTGGVAFWSRNFEQLRIEGRAVWFGMTL
jgi:GNAT superfamily N-acetyltransferase